MASPHSWKNECHVTHVAEMAESMAVEMLKISSEESPKASTNVENMETTEVRVKPQTKVTFKHM